MEDNTNEILIDKIKKCFKERQTTKKALFFKLQKDFLFLKNSFTLRNLYKKLNDDNFISETLFYRYMKLISENNSLIPQKSPIKTIESKKVINKISNSETEAEEHYDKNVLDEYIKRLQGSVYLAKKCIRYNISLDVIDEKFRSATSVVILGNRIRKYLEDMGLEQI